MEKQFLEQILNELQKVNKRLDSMENRMGTTESDLKELKVEQKITNTKLDSLEKKVDVINDQTAKTTEMFIDAHHKIEDLNHIIAQNCVDIARLKGKLLDK